MYIHTWPDLFGRRLAGRAPLARLSCARRPRGPPRADENTLCHTMLCYAMLCYAMLCYAMLCYAMLCYAMLCYAICY